MGNVSGHDGASARSDGQYGSGRVGRTDSADSVSDSPPESPRRPRSPALFTPQDTGSPTLQLFQELEVQRWQDTGSPMLQLFQELEVQRWQVPVSPLQRPVDALSPLFNQLRINDAYGSPNAPLENGIPTLITWSHGGNEVALQGSWDNRTSRKALHKSGKDHSILLVLPSGIYHYKFIVDGEWRHAPDIPFIADETGRLSNILDVTENVPEDLASIKEFESPPSPVSGYSNTFLEEEEYAKEPPAIPPQQHLTVLGSENSEGPSPSKPQHVILNHLFIEKGWASKSLVAIGLTHRYRSKYVTVVVYKPLKV